MHQLLGGTSSEHPQIEWSRLVLLDSGQSRLAWLEACTEPLYALPSWKLINTGRCTLNRWIGMVRPTLIQTIEDVLH